MNMHIAAYSCEHAYIYAYIRMKDLYSVRMHILCMNTKNINKTCAALGGSAGAGKGKTYRFFEPQGSYMSPLTPEAQLALSNTLERARGKRISLQELQALYMSDIEQQIKNIVEYMGVRV